MGIQLQVKSEQSRGTQSTQSTQPCGTPVLIRVEEEQMPSLTVCGLQLYSTAVLVEEFQGHFLG